MARDTFNRKTLRQDPFRDTMLNLLERVSGYRKTVIAVVTVLVMGTGAAFGFYGYSQLVAKRQAELFYKAEKAFVNTSLEDEERLTAAREAFGEFLRSYPDSPLSPFALMILAKIAWEQSDFQEAERKFKAAMEQPRASPTLKNLAKIGQAKLLENKGQFDQSAEIYLSLPESQLADVRDFNLGRIAVAGGRIEEARKHLESVVNRFPRSRVSDWANAMLSFLP